MASVTTRLGTRPTAVMMPVTSPQARPTPSPTRKTTGIGIPWWAWNMFAETYANQPIPRDGDAEDHTAQAPHPRGVAGLRLADADGGGARIEALDPASIAADGLHVGDVLVEVDHAPVQGAADATRRLAQAPLLPRPASHTLLVRIRREGSFLYLGIDLDRT